MAEHLTVHIDGLRELDGQLHTFAAKVARNMLRRAARRGGRVFRDEMRMSVPRSHKTKAEGKSRRHLADDIHVRLKRSSPETAIAEVGPSRKTAWVANFLELGTAPHTIKARKAKMLFVPGVGFVKKVKHPGSAAHPFIRPAFDAQWRNVVKVVANSLRQSIERGK